MQVDEPMREGARVLGVCNACRYCEQYCPMFQAMEQRLTFASADVNYLANLCHNCGECLYACQYAPPHELAINVPQTLARVRVHAYEQYAWPAALAGAFRRHDVTAALLLAGVMIALLVGAALARDRDTLLDAGNAGDFYAVVPHMAMVALFGGVGLFVLVALVIGVLRCHRDLRSTAAPAGAERDAHATSRALHDAATLRHLHVSGSDCVSALETRTPWRRLFHHATFYGFVLCFASTCVAALYHLTGSTAPYDYASAPVLLGTLGGVGLVIGPIGLLAQRRWRDPKLTDAGQERLDRAFLVLLLATSLTGLSLLAWRHTPFMGVLLLVHLGVVLALFVTLPYGKFVHGLYRAAALLEYRRGEAIAARAVRPES